MENLEKMNRVQNDLPREDMCENLSKRIDGMNREMSGSDSVQKK
jgi:hypothetical protein